MKLIIDIPEKVVTAIQNGEDYRYDIHTTIAQGIHYEFKGDLISRNTVIRMFNTMDRYKADKLILQDTDKEFQGNEVFIVDDCYELLDLIDNAPTVEPKTGEWIKDKNPDKDGAYLCISGIGNMACFRRILYFTHDLYQIDRYAFHKYRYKKKTERSGWYTLDSEMGYFEVDVHAWCELPEMPEEFRR